MMMGMIAYFVAMALDQFSYLFTDRMVEVLLVGVEVVLFVVGTGDFLKMVEFVILATAFGQVAVALNWWGGMLRTVDV